MGSISRFLALEGNIRVLAAQALISQVGFGMFYVIWQPYLLSTGITLSQLGLVQTMINISTGLGLFVWGYVSDRYGRKPVVVAADACRIVAIIVLIVSKSYSALIAYAFLIGFTAMFQMGNPGRNALIAESVDSAKRATALSTLSAISQGVSTLMASAGGYIALTMGYMPILYATLISDVIGFIMLIRFIKETHRPETSPAASPIEKIRGILLPEPENLNLYTIMLVQGFGYAVAYSLFYGALTDYRGFTTLDLGFMSTSFNLVWALGSIPLGKLSDRLGRKRMLTGSLITAMITVLGFILFRSPTAYIIFNGVSAIDICFWMPSWTSLLVEIVPKDRRSTIMGKLDAYGRIGAVPAPWLAGLLLEGYGFSAPLYVQVATLTLGMALILKIRDPNAASAPRG